MTGGFVLAALKRWFTFAELAVALALPWKLRCAYAALLFRLEAGMPHDDGQREFEFHFHLGQSYFNEGAFDKAIGHLNRALAAGRDHPGALEARRFLSLCYKQQGATDTYIESALGFYQAYKKSHQWPADK